MYLLYKGIFKTPAHIFTVLTFLSCPFPKLSNTNTRSWNKSITLFSAHSCQNRSERTEYPDVLNYVKYYVIEYIGILTLTIYLKSTFSNCPLHKHTVYFHRKT